MAKDKSGNTSVERIDLRIPTHLYSQIVELAEDTNQPCHKSGKAKGKRILTPLILNLVMVGLEATKRGEVKPEAIATKDSLLVSEIEATVLRKIEATIEKKIAEAVKVAINPLIETPEATATIAEDSEAITEANETQEDNETMTIEQSEAIQEATIAEESSKGLKSGDLGKRLGYNGKNPHSTLLNQYGKMSKEDFLKWVASKDPEGIAWYRKEGNEKDKLFYPVS